MNSNNLTATLTIRTPIGPICLTAQGEKLVCCVFGARLTESCSSSEFLHAVASTLRSYFRGNDGLKCVSLELTGTSFQLNVWNELRRIGFGNTASYGEIARRIGKPTAFRAVAQACAANKLCLFIPCHRVIAANGLGGYSAGIEKKRFLLDLENPRP